MTPGEIVFIILAFTSGSLPLSLWIGRMALDVDIRDYGDGNPGATNVVRAGGIKWGAVAFLADTVKAGIPVGLATYVFGFTGLPLLLVAIAPPLGHAFSPFLGFRGGKALAATAGTWVGLTLLELAFVMMVMMVFWFMAVTLSGWVVVLVNLSMLLYLVLRSAPPIWFAVWFVLFALAIYKHRDDLSQRLVLKMSPLLRPILNILFPHMEINHDRPHRAGISHH